MDVQWFYGMMPAPTGINSVSFSSASDSLHRENDQSGSRLIVLTGGGRGRFRPPVLLAARPISEPEKESIGTES